MFCANCGKVVPDGANACPNCGAALQGQNGGPVSQPQQPVYQQPAYQQPVYQQPVYQQRPRNPQDGKGLSITALVLGICGVALCWIGGLNIVILVLSILGIIFGVIGRKKSIAAYGKASGLATAGLVLGIIGTAISGIGVLACTACAACIGETASYGSLLY